MKTKKELAKSYAEMRFWVLPLEHLGKKPITPNGYKDATRGQEKIEHYWDIQPDSNIGISCEPSGIIGIDCDYDEKKGYDGLKTLLEIEENINSPLPKTVIVDTPRGGCHFYFKVPENFTPKGKLANSIDLKFNGYLVAPGSSISLNGNIKEYRFKDNIGFGDIEIPELPEEWIRLLSKSNEIQKQQNNNKKNYPKKYISIEDFRFCNFTNHCIDNAENLTYHEWWGASSLLSMYANGRELFHEISKPYTNYNVAETDRLFNSSEKFGKPMTCAFISSISEACNSCKIGEKGCN